MTVGFDVGRVRAALLLAASSSAFGYVGGYWCSRHQLPAASEIALNCMLSFSFFYIARPWRRDYLDRLRRLVGR